MYDDFYIIYQKKQTHLLREREVKMKAYYYLVAVLIIFGTASCGFKSSDEYNALQAKNDCISIAKMPVPL